MTDRNKAFTIGITIALMCFIMIILFHSLNVIKNTNMYIQCCGGQQCTDTYYTAEDNKCHLVLCENSLFMDNCTYDGANKTINMRNGK